MNFVRCMCCLWAPCVPCSEVAICLQALMAAVDSIDAFSLLQNMAPMSYDSSRLVDVACIAYAHVDAAHVAELRGRFLATVEKQFQVRAGFRTAGCGVQASCAALSCCTEHGCCESLMSIHSSVHPALAWQETTDLLNMPCTPHASAQCTRSYGSWRTQSSSMTLHTCSHSNHCPVQDRFGKAPDASRSVSDEDAGLCFEWAPASLPLPDSPGSAGVVALAGPYMPLQGSLLPDAESDSLPMQLSLPRNVGPP